MDLKIMYRKEIQSYLTQLNKRKFKPYYKSVDNKKDIVFDRKG